MSTEEWAWFEELESSAISDRSRKLLACIREMREALEFYGENPSKIRVISDLGPFEISTRKDWCGDYECCDLTEENEVGTRARETLARCAEGRFKSEEDSK